MPEGKINPVSIADLRPGQVAGDPDWNLSTRLLAECDMLRIAALFPEYAEKLPEYLQRRL
jgi:hypothetical protein